MALTYKQFKDHLLLAIGGYPSLAPEQTRDERLSQICNNAGDYLYSIPWNFRVKTSRPINTVSGQNFVTLDNDMVEVISVAMTDNYGASKDRVSLVTPQEMDTYRTTFPSAALVNPTYVYACMSRPWADSGGTTEIVEGTALPIKRLELHPTPASTTTGALVVRYRTAFPQTTATTLDTFILAIPNYCEGLFIAIGRAFALGYEDEGVQQHLMNVQNGPLLAMAMQADGMTLQDGGLIRRSPNKFNQQQPQAKK